MPEMCTTAVSRLPTKSRLNSRKPLELFVTPQMRHSRRGVLYSRRWRLCRMALSRSCRRITKDDARIVRSKVPSLERARDVKRFSRRDVTDVTDVTRARRDVTAP